MAKKLARELTPQNRGAAPRAIRRALPWLAATMLWLVGGHPASAADLPTRAVECHGVLPEASVLQGGQENLLVDGTCLATGSTFMYNKVWIRRGADGKPGRLIFVERPPSGDPDKPAAQDFWASSIIVENGGELLAGVDDPDQPSGAKPYGSNGGVLTIHLYGAETSGPGELCSVYQDAPTLTDCGIPKADWDDNGKTVRGLPGGVQDYFYAYGNLHGNTGPGGHFGYKELAVSYGGTLRLRGAKGTSGTTAADIATMLKPPAALTAADEASIVSSGSDWARLAGMANGDTVTLDRNVAGDWQKNDEIVVTTTDFFPNHSEAVRLSEAPTAGQSSFHIGQKLKYNHSTTAYDIAAKVNDKAGNTDFVKAIKRADGNDSFLGKAETRAAVALLSRSIRIVSAGDQVNEPFPDPIKGAEHSYMYGGHVVFRQGFAKVQIQGVEFKQLGQGGALGRYPVHFHIARRVPTDTYVIDSSVNESMTRWVVLHSTQGVTLARNVGYKSIGHGFFLEDATETDNRLYANIGIYARASVGGADNDRGIPGLLDSPTPVPELPQKYNSDSQYPTVFWITNGWNALAGNMAAGAGTCGMCYWYIPAANHDMIDTDPAMNAMNEAIAQKAMVAIKPAQPPTMRWSGYSAMQAGPYAPLGTERAGLTPVQLFYKNYCSTAQHAFNVSDPSSCTQVTTGAVRAIPNPRAPAGVFNDQDGPWNGAADAAKLASALYYPRYTSQRKPAECDPGQKDDNNPASCRRADCDYDKPELCVPTIVSHLTTQFNWAETNFAAVWMRAGFLNVDHMFLADVMGPGITMVTGGDYSRSNLPKGYWGLLSHSILVGQTQKTSKDDTDKYNYAAGGPLACTDRGNYCFDPASGVAFPRSNWGTGQRLYNVYDGPAYEDANAYLDVRVAPCAKPPFKCMYYGTLGVRKALSEIKGSPYGDIGAGTGYLPNAAIGWKQSNGFYYPPAFRSSNLLFRNVDIRHYVVEPEFFTGTYRTNMPETEKQFAHNPNDPGVFTNYSDVDRQTELSDDDGSLTGFSHTVIANEDPFFRAPVQTAECRSNVGVDGSNACKGETPPSQPTARTTPYDYVTTAIVPAAVDPEWSMPCSNETCYGVRLYRQNLTGTLATNAAGSTREWETWKANGCDARFAELKDKPRPVPTWDPYKDGTLHPPSNPEDPAWDFIKFDLDCPAPAVRLAGMNKLQRSALTVNNGTYFLDTTRSLDFQLKSPELRRPNPNLERDPRNVNVFQKGKTYYLYLLFARNTTKQTYQVYGGQGFTAGNVKPIRVDVKEVPPPPSAVTELPAVPWLTVTPDSVPGVLDITLDISKAPRQGNGKIELDPAKAFSETCKPSTFCTVSNGKCGCDADKLKLGLLTKLSPSFKNVCDQICGNWAVKDMDCPEGGCLGFKFTMPDSFVADNVWHRPMPTPYFTDKTPVADPWKTIKLNRTSTVPDNAQATGGPAKGGCFYPKIPNDAGDCKVSD